MTPHSLRALQGKAILLTGANGMLARGFQEALAEQAVGARLLAFSHEALDVRNERAVMALASQQVDIILHCAGKALADECEASPALARAVHVEGTKHIGRLAKATGARVFYPQSVFIFDGQELPVSETSIPTPVSVYGRVKLEAERYLLDNVPGALVVRMAGFFGGDERDKNFVGQFTRRLTTLLGRGLSTCDVGDRVWQPTYTLDLARNTLLLLAGPCEGIYHMGALGEATFHAVAVACVDALGGTGRMKVRSCSAAEFARTELVQRPRRMVTANLRLDREGLNLQRPWREALGEYLARPHFDALRRAFGARL